MDLYSFPSDLVLKRPTQYAKEAEEPNSIAIRITAFNRGPDPATLHIVPQLWFPNTWSWPDPEPPRPSLTYIPAKGDLPQAIYAKHETLGKTRLWCSTSPFPINAQGEAITTNDQSENGVVPELMFTENDTNYRRLYGGKNRSPHVKDAFHDHIIPSHRPLQEDLPPNGVALPELQDPQFINPNKRGTKAGVHYTFNDVPGNGGCVVTRLKLTPRSPERDATIYDEELFDNLLDERRSEADEFYNRLIGGALSEDFKQIGRQALAGMLWSKQYYQFIQSEWIKGDPAQPPPPPERKWIRNRVRL